MDVAADTIKADRRDGLTDDSEPKTSLIFQNEDIIGVIMQHYRAMIDNNFDRSLCLVWAALTSHSFLNAGLDALWYTLDSPFPLLSLLSNFSREDSSLKGPADESDWKKFDDYACRVRIVRLWHNHVAHAGVLEQVKALHPHYILPGLQHIDLQLLTRDNIEAVKFYLSPNLTSLDIREGRDLRRLYDTSEKLQLSALLKTICTVPSIRLAKLSMTILLEHDYLDESFRQLLHLSRLKTGLSKVLLLPQILFNSQLMDLDLHLVDELQFPATFQSAPRLKRLNLIHLPLSLNLFPQSSNLLFPNLTSLKIKILELQEWAVTNHQRWTVLIFPPNLTHLEIVSNPVILDHWDAVPTLPFHTLTRNRHLKSLSIRAKIELTEIGLQHVSEEAQWESLEYLRLIAVQADLGANPLLVLGFLAQHCPKLCRLEIAIISYRPSKTPDNFQVLRSFLQSDELVPPHLQLQCLDIYMDEDYVTPLVNEEILQQAQYIHSLFPNVRQLGHLPNYKSVLVESFNSYVERKRNETRIPTP
ncbi:hypothetical protein CPB83DRAFT_904808 [Crepidotus variabilis]|uniref:Uncharacterized protein n=1 Tax=Crepidotus variabilis TaxID=179855 RepID=A0A9P6JSX4_9AGAR|nr:hypothetical protein CPB83DRAFT_904808 [Crepidotus variabilis]